MGGGQVTQRAVPAQVERRDVVHEHERPARVGVDIVQHVGTERVAPRQQRPFGMELADERAPAAARGHGAVIEIAQPRRRVLGVDVHHGEPRGVGPEAPQQVAAVAEAVEPAPAHAVRGHPVARVDGGAAHVEAEPQRPHRVGPVPRAERHARHRGDGSPRPRARSEERQGCDPLCEVAGDERSGGKRVGGDESVAGERERGEQSEQQPLARLAAAAERSPQRQRRPARH